MRYDTTDNTTGSIASNGSIQRYHFRHFYTSHSYLGVIFGLLITNVNLEKIGVISGSVPSSYLNIKPALDYQEVVVV